MKEKLNNKYLAWGLTIFCVLGALIMFFFAIYKWRFIVSFLASIIGILSPILYGLAIAYLMNPLVKFLEEKVFSKLCRKFAKTKKEKYRVARALAIAGTFIVFLGIIVGCFSILIPQLVESLNNFINNSGDYLNNAKETLISLFGGSDSLRELINNNYEAIYQFFSTWVREDVLDNFLDTLGSSIFGTLKVLYNVVIGFIISVYLLFDKEKFVAQARKIMYSFLSTKQIEIVSENLKYTDKIFGNFFSAKVIDSLIIGVLCFIGMLIFRIPYATVIAVLVGVTNIIPYFGPFIGAIPSCVLIFLVSPSKCITFIIFIFILQQFDGNILGPKIMGGKTGLSSFWVLCSLLIFGGLFGVLGMIIGVPIFSILYLFINNLLKRRLKDKDLPLDSKDYMNPKFIKKRVSVDE